MNRVAVIGGGAFGTALANAAAEAGRDVTLCLRDPAVAAALTASRVNPRLPDVPLHRALRPTADLDAVRQAETTLLVVPAQQVRAAVERLLPVLPHSCPLVVCAKGIERGTGAFMSEICEDLSPDLVMAILSGPSFAADLGRGLPTAVTLACHDPVTAMRLASALSGPAFRIYHSGDVRGVEIGGAAKNVLAIAAGIVVGRQLGESARAALVARGFAELRRFALACGGRPETLMGLSGLGDVVMSCASPQSRNFAFGNRIGGGLSPAEAGEGTLAEGAFTAEALLERARAQGVDMPVAEAVADIVAGRRSVDEAMAALLARPLRPEHD